MTDQGPTEPRHRSIPVTAQVQQVVPEDLTVYDAVGGRPFFDALVTRFYEGVATDPVLRPLYPEDLTESIEATAGFLAQYWGGGTQHYSDLKGHPRLRMRHGHVRIDQAARDRWVHHMREAVAESGVGEDLAAQLNQYFELGASAMINTAD